MAGININVDMKKIEKELNKRHKNAQKCIDTITGDLKRRVPPVIAQGVAEEYNIKARDKRFKECLRTTESGNGGTRRIGIIYKEEEVTPVHFGMKPKSRPQKNRPYGISAQIKKGSIKTLHGKPEYAGKPFLADNGHGTDIQFQRIGRPGKNGATERTNLASIKVISIPQMIMNGNGEMKPNVEKALNERIEERLNHYAERYLKKK